MIRAYACEALGRQGAEGAAHASRVAAKLQDPEEDVRDRSRDPPPERGGTLVGHQ